MRVCARNSSECGAAASHSGHSINLHLPCLSDGQRERWQSICGGQVWAFDRQTNTISSAVMHRHDLWFFSSWRVRHVRLEVEVHGEPAQCSPAVICIVYYENAIAATGLNWSSETRRPPANSISQINLLVGFVNRISNNCVPGLHSRDRESPSADFKK